MEADRILTFKTYFKGPPFEIQFNLFYFLLLLLLLNKQSYIKKKKKKQEVFIELKFLLHFFFSNYYLPKFIN